MGWNNPAMPWRHLEALWSDRPIQDGTGGPDGGDSPAWSRKRAPYQGKVVDPRPGPRVPYAELHCHSSFSFLDGASLPESLAEEGARLGLEALALTDHNGFYGVVRFADAARSVGLPTVFGAELTLDMLDIAPGRADPDGSHLLILARDPRGYGALSRLISETQLAGEKGAPRCTLDDLDRWLTAEEFSHLVCLTGCRKGTVPRALEREGPAAAGRALGTLVDLFGYDGVRVELWDHGDPLDSARNDAMVRLANQVGVDVVATNNVHYATPAERRLATAMAAVRARRSLSDMDGWLPASSGAHLRSGWEMARRFSRYPGVIERAAELGLACAFDLSLVAPRLPPYPCPDDLDEMAYLRRLVEVGGTHRYGPREASWVPGAWEQLDRELSLIDDLGFPGYFLVIWDIVEFCRQQDIYCQGRGSAANSAVCYVLGITKADAVSLGLLFERFLAPERDGPPDIDLDIESDRREEVIQYVYQRHGRRHAAQVANVITYRGRSAVRDAAKALGYAQGQQDAFAKAIDRWGFSATASDEAPEVPDEVVDLARQFRDLPRHLGIHSGGMVMCDRPVIEVCPVEPARMEDRTVLQWDKDDCASAGLVKFDLLGLGMLSAIHYAVDFVAEHHGVEVDLAALEQEDAVYDMLCEADSVGVFQIESRAQMATLPRLRPRHFYDLVVEIALIRPGPIQGGSVHPYIRRRNGQEPVTYLHPLLEPSLEKTLGVPLFQEQLMQMAIDLAGFSPAEADQLRRAMGSKRSVARMEELKARFLAGMREREVMEHLDDPIGEQLWNKLVAFANYGFPESHSISFAYLVYASSWLKLHYPAAFCAALLKAQPMGFYSPHSLVQDARRHGVLTLGPNVNVSEADATLEPMSASVNAPDITVRQGAAWNAEAVNRERRDHGWAVRLGIGSVRGIGPDVAERLADGRPFASVEDVARRGGLNREQLESLATAGAFDCFDEDATQEQSSRRRALWQAGAVAQMPGDGRLPGIVTGMTTPQLPGMSDQELALADLWATGVAADGHPTRFLRSSLTERNVVCAKDLNTVNHGDKVLVAGVVTHRQRPATASGTTFIGMEDETGLMNVVVSVGCWQRYRRVARNAPALLIRGRLERQGGDTGSDGPSGSGVPSGGAINIVAEKLEALPLGGGMPSSRDFR